MLEKTNLLCNMNITPYVSWFITCLTSSYEEAALAVEKSFKVKEFFKRARNYKINKRQNEFLPGVLDETWEGAITAKKYASLTKCHVDTANEELKKLVEYKLIKKEVGSSKNTHYSILL